MLPGQVENWVILLDLTQFGLFTSLLSTLRKVMTFIQAHHRGRLFKMHVLNTPLTIYIPWSIVKAFFEPSSVSKVAFHSTQRPLDLLHHISVNQLEQKFGGNEPNQTQFWPPTAPTLTDVFLPTDNPNQLLVSEVEYFELLHHGRLVNNKLSPYLVTSNEVIPTPIHKPPPLRYQPSFPEDAVDELVTKVDENAVRGTRKVSLKTDLDDKYEIFHDIREFPPSLASSPRNHLNAKHN
jgi:hypothetical protein